MPELEDDDEEEDDDSNECTLLPSCWSNLNLLNRWNIIQLLSY